MVFLFSVKFLFDLNVDSKFIGQKLHGHAYVQADSNDIQLVSDSSSVSTVWGCGDQHSKYKVSSGHGSVERKGQHDSCTCRDTHSIHTYHMTIAPCSLWLNHKTKK